MSIFELNFSTIFTAFLSCNLTRITGPTQPTSNPNHQFCLHSYPTTSSLNPLSSSLSPNITFLLQRNSKSSRYTFITVNSYCTTPLPNIPQTHQTLLENHISHFPSKSSMGLFLWLCFAVGVFFPLARTKSILPLDGDLSSYQRPT